MEPQTTECSASVWPHRHTDEMSGPLDIKISFRNQPPLVKGWTKNHPLYVCLEQPDEKTNLTMLWLAFDFAGGPCPFTKGHEHHKWYNINSYRTPRDHSLRFYIKSRVIKSVPHPIPRGKWSGTCHHTNKWCMFTFQAMTMKVKPKDEPRIVLPDGTLPAKKKIKLVIP